MDYSRIFRLYFNFLLYTQSDFGTINERLIFSQSSVIVVCHSRLSQSLIIVVGYIRVTANYHPPHLRTVQNGRLEAQLHHLRTVKKSSALQQCHRMTLRSGCLTSEKQVSSAPLPDRYLIHIVTWQVIYTVGET